MWRCAEARRVRSGARLETGHRGAGGANLLPPSAACPGKPYGLPRVFDPWTDAEQDPEKRGNSPADAVFPISPRPLRKALHFALPWPPYPEYPEAGSGEEALQLALGFALRDSEQGQRALGFQGRLA
jgi:hypothetical protein